MKNKKLHLVTVILLILTLLMSSVCVSFGASKTKTMNAYTTIKKGNYVYCAAYKGIYKVNIKTGKKTRIYKETNPELGGPGPMVLYKGYLYYEDNGDNSATLYRVKTNGRNRKYLGHVFDFAIKGNTIYYTSPYEKTLKRKMNLNGKHKRKSSYNVNTKFKKTNAKGYYVKSKNTRNGVVDYLVTPRKTIKLCSYTETYY